MSYVALPCLSAEIGLARYLQEISKFPILSEIQERECAMRWADLGDIAAAHTLVTSHLRLVAKTAMKFTGYGLPVVDIISEGNLGLMHAVKKYDLQSGNRFATYAIWWIKAYIQDYVLKSWSVVKMGTSSAKKKLFYNLRKIKEKLSQDELTANETIQKISDELNVSVQEVEDMETMMSSSQLSLNNQSHYEGDEEVGDTIADPSPCHDLMIIENQDYSLKRDKLRNAMQELSERERDIISSRMLEEKPITLDSLSIKYGVSCERIRQIESRAFEKLKKSMNVNIGR